MKKELLKVKQDEDIIYLIKILSKKLRNRYDKKLNEFDLTAQQGRCLCFICQNYKNNIETHQNDIEDKFELSKSTVSGLVDRLEKKEFIRRVKSHPHTLLLPTEKGEAVIENILSGRLETVEKLLKGFNEEEILNLVNIINKLIMNIKEEDE